MMFNDLLVKDPLIEFLTQTDNALFEVFKSNYKINYKHMYNQLYKNCSIKFIKNNIMNEEFPKLICSSFSSSNKSKMLMPKYCSKYLEKSEFIFKKLSQQFTIFENHLQKSLESCLVITELFNELSEEKKTLETKIPKSFDNLKDTFYNTSKFFESFGK